MRAMMAAVLLGASAIAGAQGTSVGLMHTEVSFDVVVPANYEATAPLFGPEGERAWAGKHWQPNFLYPNPAQDRQGAIFTIQHGSFTALWVVTRFDVEARHFQYVYTIPDIMVTMIDVRFLALAADSTKVSVTYTRTAITQAGNQHVMAMSETDKGSGAEWQRAIDAYLGTRKPARMP